MNCGECANTKCYNWTKVAKPAPAEAAPSVEDRLREAGARVGIIDRVLSNEADIQADICGSAVDIHVWGLTPDRAVAALKAARGEDGPKCSDYCVDLTQQLAAARALSLPLDLAEGEEAWTDERLGKMDDDTPPSCIHGAELHCQGLRNLGLDNLRRWRLGWICKRIAKPASGPVWLGEWRGWKLWYSRDDGRVGVERNGAVEMWWQPSIPLMLDRPPEMVNALLTAYRRAVAAKLATVPAGWEWLRDEMPKNWPTDVLWIGHEPVILPGVERPTISKEESTRRAALLGLCDAKPGEWRDDHDDTGMWMFYPDDGMGAKILLAGTRSYIVQEKNPHGVLFLSCNGRWFRLPDTPPDV